VHRLQGRAVKAGDGVDQDVEPLAGDEAADAEDKWRGFR
jgi:hypothetical protein